MGHWATGKTAEAMIYKPGDLPLCCTETIVFQATSNWLYVMKYYNYRQGYDSRIVWVRRILTCIAL